MIQKIIFSIILTIFITGCTYKQPIASQGATIIFKTANMKFYDKGFVTKYDNYIHLQIFSVGIVALDLKIYKDEICKDSLRCMNSKDFNEQYISSSHEYKDDFLYKLFSQDNVNFKDRKNKIFIKIKKD